MVQSLLHPWQTGTQGTNTLVSLCCRELWNSPQVYGEIQFQTMKVQLSRNHTRKAKENHENEFHACIAKINKNNRKDTPKKGSSRWIFPQPEDEALLGSNINVLQPSLEFLASKDFWVTNQMLALHKEDRIPAVKKIFKN